MPIDRNLLSRLALTLVESVPHGIVLTDARRSDNPIVWCNEAFLRLTGYAESEILDRNCRFLQGPETDPGELERLRAAVAAGRSITVALRNYRKDRTGFWNALSVTPLHDDAGELTHFVGIQTDISEVKLLEQQFRQSQKLEAMGQMAAGVAHDFNNLLTVINGYAELLGGAGASQQVADIARIILRSGNRAASMTRHLLAFTRNERPVPTVLDVNQLITESDKVLRRLIGPVIQFTPNLAADVMPVRADASQLDQVLMNLVVNARDAMPSGGTLTISTANDPSGSAVLISVADTGQGIPLELREKIFDAFFTTKEVGKGTGLGLATVRRIVEESHGTITLDSVPGRTSFNLRFPAADPASLRDREDALTSPARGTEVIMLIDDEPAVRELMTRTLRDLGYTVLDAPDGKTALALIHEHRGPLHLVLTDVAMPGLSARAVADQLLAIRPETRLLLISGLPLEPTAWLGFPRGTPAFEPKPFKSGRLAQAIRRVLDSRVS